MAPPLSTIKRKRGKKREVVFNPEARKEYLRGFSERKRQRRAYGLSMQKVKDRNEKIEQRAQEKKDDLERIEEAERQKAVLMEEAMKDSGALKDEESENDSDDESKDEDEKKDTSTVLNSKTYDDKKTESQWGGQVTVTTSVVSLFDDSDDEDERKAQKSVDKQQKYAGNVDKYMSQLKGKMPSKKSRDHQNTKRKGKNGAADMKGMGGSANLKIAQKMLMKTKAHQKPGASSQKKKGGKKGRRR